MAGSGRLLRNKTEGEMRRTLTMGTLVVVMGALTGACATKGYVKQNVGDVNTKVDSLSQSLEDTQQRTKDNEGRIGKVDQATQAAQAAADAANNAAGAADTRAGAAGSAAAAAAAK